tara:strand:+ start:1012 stop:1383 length:372 start_codon:yes stop_codon:yes gene_type:complete
MTKQSSVIRRNSRRRNRSKKTSRYNKNYLRLVVYRSLKHFEAQIVDDFEGKTVLSASSRDKSLKAKLKKVKNKTDISKVVGEAIASKAKKDNIETVVLDRNGYPYHGRVRAFADSARENGLKL